MPAIKSPGKILKLWKQGTKDYLSSNSLKELEPQEQFLSTKIVKGLERLRKLAQTKTAGTTPDAVEFTDARDTTVDSLNKFRKAFKPKKEKPKVKPFYTQVCRLTLVVEKLAIVDLDADETDTPPTFLDDLNANEIDVREQQRGEAQSATVQPDTDKGKTPPAPPSPDERKWQSRFGVIEPLVLQAIQEQRGDASKLRAVLSFATEKAESKNFAQALKSLETLNTMLNAAGMPGTEPPQKPAPTVSDEVNQNLAQKNKDTQQLQLLRQEFAKLQGDPPGASGEHIKALGKLRTKADDALKAEPSPTSAKTAADAVGALKTQIDAITKEIQKAQWEALDTQIRQALQEQRGDTSKMRAILAYAGEKAGKEEYPAALKALGELAKVLPTATAPVRGDAPAASQDVVGDELERARAAFKKEYQSDERQKDPEGATDKEKQHLETLRTIVGNALTPKVTTETLAHLENTIKDLRAGYAKVKNAVAERPLLKGELTDKIADKLATKLEPDQVRKLITATDAATVKKLATGLEVDAFVTVTEKVTPATLKHLALDLNGAAIVALEAKVDKPTLDKLVGTLTGKEILKLTSGVGGPALVKLAATLTGTQINDLFDGSRTAVRGPLDANLGIPGGLEPTNDEAKELVAKTTKALGKNLNQLAGDDEIDKGVNQLADTIIQYALDGLKALLDKKDKALYQTYERTLGKTFATNLAATLKPTAKTKVQEAAKAKGGVKALGFKDLVKPAGEIGNLLAEKLADMVGGTGLKNLATDLDGTTIQQLSTTLSAEFLANVAAEPGSGAAIKGGVENFGDLPKLTQVLAKAKEKSMSASAVPALLKSCKKHNAKRPSLKDPAKMETFITKAASAPRPTDPNKKWDWDKAVKWLDNCADKYEGTVGYTGGSQDGSAELSSTEVTLPGGAKRKIAIHANDLKHYQSGHTFEQIAVVPDNFATSDFKSFWEVGTTPAKIQERAKKALQDATVLQMIKAQVDFYAAAANNQERRDRSFCQCTVKIDSIECIIGIDVVKNRITQFYPASTGIHKSILEGIKEAVGM